MTRQPVVTGPACAEDALRASEERFRSAFNNASVGFAIADLERRLVQVNPQYCELTGYTEAELIGMDYIQMTHPEDRDQNLEVIRKVLDGEQKAVPLEKRYIRKTGEVIWVQISISLIRDSQGRPLHTLALCHDITERKEAEMAIRETEERFRILTRATNEVIWDWDIPGDRIWCNDSIETALGYHPDELGPTRADWNQRIHHDDLPMARQSLETCLRSGEFRWSATYRFRRRDGTYAHVLDRGFIIRDQDGQAIRMVGSLTEVSERIRAEESLRRSEELYRFLFHGNPLPMWIYDAESLRFLEVNEAAIAHYGYSRSEFLSQTITQIRPAEDVPRLMEMFRSGVMLSERTSTWRHVKKDGTVIRVEVTGRPINFQGRPARLVLANDVTERLSAEEKILEQAALLNETSDAIVLCDLEHRIRFWNRGAEQLYGWTAHEVRGAPVSSFLHQDPASFRSAIAQLNACGAWQGEVEQRTKSGKSLMVLGRWTLARSIDGNVSGVLAIYTDITERKRLEAQFFRAQRLESVGTLAGGIAHDLNNVLAPIIMGMDLLRLSVRDPEGLELIDTIQATAKRGASLIRQVLSFARGMDGQRVLVDLRVVVDEIQKIVSETFPRNIQTRVHTPKSVPPVLGDPTQLHQVLLNLCVNARDAMPSGGLIAISLSQVTLHPNPLAGQPRTRAGPHLQIRVSDEGVGIPATIRDRIFEPFFTTKELGKGTGLGLATVMAIVRSHDGFIQVDSEVGRGTTFTIHLPAASGNAPESALAPSRQLPRGRGEMILVVDDEASVRTVTQQTLEAFGYRVLTAANGAAAMQIYEAHPDELRVVLTDMMMPVMDGLAFVGTLRRLRPDLKIIAASGLDPRGPEGLPEASGVDLFLPKPYEAPALLEALHRLLHE